MYIHFHEHASVESWPRSEHGISTVASRRQARYEEIAGFLRGLISTAGPGDRLPSDAELCEQFGVSRMTARQAVHVLVAEGLVERKRGAGTFVAARRVPRLLGSPLSFTESMRARGMVAASRLIRRGQIEPSADERDALALSAGTKAYLLERLRLADGTAMAIERAVMPLWLVMSLTDDIESGSLHSAFEHAGHYPTKAMAEVTARSARKRDRDLLQLSAGGVLLEEKRTIWDQHDQPMERTVTSYVADRYSFEAMLFRGQDGPRE